MDISKKKLFEDLEKLNNNEYSFQKDRDSYNEFINSLDEKFKTYLDENLLEADMYLIHAIFNMIDFHDEYGSMEICKKCWENCRDERALVFICYILDDYQGGIHEALFNELIKLESSAFKIKSCIEMYIGIYYLKNDTQAFIQNLNKSIVSYENNVHAYFILGRYYSEIKNLSVANAFFKQGVSHVVTVSKIDDFPKKGYDFYSIDNYFDEMILWSDCTYIKYNHLTNQIR